MTAPTAIATLAIGLHGRGASGVGEVAHECGLRVEVALRGVGALARRAVIDPLRSARGGLGPTAPATRGLRSPLLITAPITVLGVLGIPLAGAALVRGGAVGVLLRTDRQLHSGDLGSWGARRRGWATPPRAGLRGLVRGPLDARRLSIGRTGLG